MTFLLDTNVLIHAQRGHPVQVVERLMEVGPGDVAISVITVAELWYGAARSPDPDRKKKLWCRFLEPYAKLSFDEPAAELHGDLRYALRHQPIGERDLILACTAITHDLALVTANFSALSRVPGLRVEDWTR